MADDSAPLQDVSLSSPIPQATVVPPSPTTDQPEDLNFDGASLGAQPVDTSDGDETARAAVPPMSAPSDSGGAVVVSEGGTPDELASAQAPAEAPAQEESRWSGGRWGLLAAVSQATYMMGDVAAGAASRVKGAVAESGTASYVKETISGVSAKVSEKMEQVDVSAIKDSLKEKASTTYTDFRQDPRGTVTATASAAASVAVSAASGTASVAASTASAAYEKAKTVASESQTVAAAVDVSRAAVDKATSVGGKVVDKATSVGGKVVDKATSVGGKVADTLSNSETLQKGVDVSRTAIATAASAAAGAASAVGEVAGEWRGANQGPTVTYLQLQTLLEEKGVVSSMQALEAASMASRNALREARSSLDEAAIAQVEREVEGEEGRFLSGRGGEGRLVVACAGCGGGGGVS